ncbi:cupredoxin domain-containing protein [Hoeflea alexandrii]|uniref:cupredoxin domain-containing protein n=1 Tax=Hoeflea alexandrii TaxID=288436 RepID=UPI0022B020FE|nr:cupredoxin family protein [Hoeflea alexandrii]MCZ4292027.1 cupredoxin family protein [Hoeflea alexandrii]
MKTLLIASASFLAMTALAVAAGTHSGGHDDMMAIGKPGKASEVSRTIEVIMKETDDGEMIFEPKEINVEKGETIRFMVMNKGELEHEFVLDDHEGVMEHKGLMERMPEMEHDDPNSVRLDPGMDGEVIWSFANAGPFEFACLIPGHYDSGMKGMLTVTGH